jgi:hypothetical protein
VTRLANGGFSAHYVRILDRFLREVFTGDKADALIDVGQVQPLPAGD